MNEVCVINTLKIAASSIAAIAAFIAFIIPFVRTYIPILLKRTPSHVLTLRIAMRLGLAILLAHEAIHPVEEYFIPSGSTEFYVLRVGITILIIFLTLMIVGSWLSHPDGMKGI